LRSKFEEENKRITVAIPKTLYFHIKRKLRLMGYATMSDLLRDLLRDWAESGTLIITTPKQEGEQT